MPFFSFDASTQDISIRLGSLEFYAVCGPARVSAKDSQRHLGELAFDVLGATAFLLNHRRLDTQTAAGLAVNPFC